MSESCNHNCDSCGENCSERKSGTAGFLKQPHPESRIKKVIGVISGKGGVGKSSVTSLLAAAMADRGLHTAILDADITGPSIPKAFGITEKVKVEENVMYPAFTKKGIQIMSINMLLDKESDPVIWRGPILAGVVQQFWSEVIWTDVDVMLVDMPPGTGDVPLTVFQSLPLDGLIVVTSPQQLVSMIVEKAVRMSREMDIPILGIVENFSCFKCPDCGKEHLIFGESRIEETAKRMGVENLLRLPIEPAFAKAVDTGKTEDEDYETAELVKKEFLQGILNSLQER